MAVEGLRSQVHVLAVTRYRGIPASPRHHSFSFCVINPGDSTYLLITASNR